METTTTAAPNPAQRKEPLDPPNASATGEPNPVSPSLYALIGQQRFFKGLSAQHIQLLTDSAIVMSFEPGQSILQEGSPANRFYLILEGKVVVESELKEGEVLPVQTLGPGDDLGWSWLFPPYHLRFSARALEPTRTILFYGPRLREECERDHDFGYELMKRITEVALQCLKATQQRLMECTTRANSPIDECAHDGING